MKLSLLLLSSCVLALGCTTQNAADDGSESSESAVEVYGQDLWAGLTSYTIERYAADPCNDGRSRLDNNPISYDSWVRQRAGMRNICFEVWKPGVTDRENPDFWRLLDVQVHYKYKGTNEWKTAYVPSIDRRGNNRRYAWSLSYDIDPVAGYNVADAKAPFEIVNELPTSAQIRSELEFYFTVNGQKLSSSTNESFKVAYFGTVEKPALEPLPNNATKGVLYPSATCTGVQIGSGAGYYAADITDQSVIDELVAANANVIHASRLALTGTGQSRVLTLRFSSGGNTAASELPNYYEGFGSAWRAETRDVNGNLAVSIKLFDRTSKTLQTVTRTFSSCVKN